MNWAFNLWDRLQKTIQALRASSSATSLANDTIERPERINDYVYEVRKPSGRPSIEIVFFHGLQLEGCKEAYLTTWLNTEGSELWLTWILQYFPEARILLVSYDACAQRKDDQGRMDMYRTCENLLQSLTEEKARVGGDGCPVILVGHSIGCLVIKELCLTLDSTINKPLPPNAEEPVQSLLQNVKGFFFYACPHLGSRLADHSTAYPKGPLFEGIRTLNEEAQRRNEDFRQLRLKYEWKTCGIGEGRPTTLGQFTDYIVPEASARYDVDSFYTFDANHFNVSRPKCTSSANFVQLSRFIGTVLQQDQDRQSPKMCIAKGIYGLEGRVDDIIEKLNKRARRLGIVGMGGIGKTTLAEAVYHTISMSFEYTCLLRDVKKLMPKKDNVEYLQKIIISSLCYKGRKVNDTFNWETLKAKKVLIVLDDVEHEAQVQVMLESDGFSEESCVIVTSRESGFLRADFEIYFMEQLNREDSKRVFCLNAFRKEVAESGYEYRMEQFLKRCDGLPLALRVAGKYLYGKNPRVWDDGLERLRQAKSLNGSKEDGLWSILEVCYESLAEEEQEMFLDVATCFHNQDLETVKRAWSVCAWASPDLGLTNLVDKGLVTIEENIVSRQGRIICMHEVLRDLGRRRACPNIENVATHTRLCYDLSNPQPMTQLLKEGKPQVKVLVINRFEDINIQSLRGLEELRILWLDDVSLRGPLSLLPAKLAYVKMIDSRLFDQLEGADSRFTEASAQREKRRKTSRYHSALKQVEIDDCILSEGFLDSLGQCQALEHLEIRSLSNWTALPESFGQLGALKHLRVASCDQLESIPHSLGDLLDLQYLVIQDCQRIKAMPESLGKLQGLKHLEVSCGCSKVPPNICRQLWALRHFETTLCPDWRDLSDWLGKLETLQKIVIHGCIDHGYPSTTIQLNFLESLARRNLLQGVGQVDLPMFYEDDVQIIASNSEFVPTSFAGLGHVRNLLIQDCGNLRALPNTLGTFQVLEDLKIVNCGSLEALPDTIGELKALQSLSIISCNSLRSLPDTLSNLQALNYLVLGCCSFTAPPHNLRQLQELLRLEITCCHGLFLKALVDTLEQLHALQSLVVHSCCNHGHISSDEQLDFLDSLTRKGILQGAGQVDLPIFRGKVLHVGASEFSRHVPLLQHASSLHITDCQDFNALGELQAQYRLNSTSDRICKSDLKSLPDTLGKLQAVELRPIQLCGNLATLPEGLGKLEALKELYLQDCSGLEVLPDSLGELRALRKFVIKSCARLKSLPEGLGKVKALRELSVQDCNSLEALPDSLGKVQALELLHIQFCGNLRALPNTLGTFQVLKDLKIVNCGSLEALPDTIGELKALQSLSIISCNSLKSLPDTLWNLQALNYLVLGCCSFTAPPHNLRQLQGLLRLEITCCHGLFLKALVDTLEQLHALQSLVVHSCCNHGHISSDEQLDFLDSLTRKGILQGAGQVDLPIFRGKVLHVGAYEFTRHVPRLQHASSLYITDCQDFNALGELQAQYRLNSTSDRICKSDLKSLPDALGKLQAVELRPIQLCGNLATLPEGLGKLEALKELYLQYCSGLEVLPDSLGELRALRKFVIKSCARLKSLPEGLGKVKALRELYVQDCNSLEALPDSLGKVQALELLHIQFCGNLRALPNTLGTFQVLKDLKIVNCGSLEALPDTIGELKALQSLSIISCNSLKSLPDTLWNLQALNYLVLGCCSFTAPPHNLRQLQGLLRLEITCCHGLFLKALVDTLEQLHALQSLVVHSCCNHGHISSDEQLDFLDSLTRKGILQGAGQVDLPIFRGKVLHVGASAFHSYKSAHNRLPGF